MKYCLIVLPIFDKKNLLPPFLRDPLVALVGSTCYESLVEDFQLTDTQCLKYALSKALGLGIVFGSAVIKVPQMITIMTRRSVKGLSLVSYYLETYAYIIILAYNIRQQNPFSTYGEVVFIVSQNVLITLMIFWYGRPAGAMQLDKSMAWTLCSNLVAFLSSFFILLLPSWVPYWLLATLYASTIPIILASKIPQIYSNYRHQSTGQLSVFAVLNYFAGTTARVFTTLAEIDDPLMLTGTILASLLNGVLVFQVYLYWNKQPGGSAPSADIGTATVKAD
ncbi:mannose-P-dolichol utilization defect 1 protein [Hesseltinella vesiculosa]|uniref:Mannose-P-dolichol utilization defect 1 protein homolog n=1 Tax=Hesseltinella vesiculosa TaxID=101127 RepID=A0A1X2GM95_9FUNG|nr:mannose-P-dolichol utilization defect 1 protein [Hesseltinella vesiculosa]